MVKLHIKFKYVQYSLVIRLWCRRPTEIIHLNNMPYPDSLEFTHSWILWNSSLPRCKHSMWHFNDLYLEYTLLLACQFVDSLMFTMSLMSCWQTQDSVHLLLSVLQGNINFYRLSKGNGIAAEIWVFLMRRKAVILILRNLASLHLRQVTTILQYLILQIIKWNNFTIWLSRKAPFSC